jgi:hypothetical protein
VKQARDIAGQGLVTATVRLGRGPTRRLAWTAGVLVVVVVVGSAGSGRSAATVVAGRQPSLSNTGTTSAKPPHFRYMALAGSPQYLVYARFRHVPSNADPEPMGGLYVLGQSGPPRRLTTIRTDVATEFTVSGSTLVYEDSSGQGGPVRLWNLKTGTQRRRSVHEVNLGTTAAPDGYLFEVRGEQRAPSPWVLKLRSLDGPVTTLGEPFLGGAEYGALTAGTSSFVVWAGGEASTGTIKSGRFDQPGHFHVVDRDPGGPTFCGAPSVSYVACLVDVERGGQAVSLFKLDGGLLAHTVKHCAGDATPAAIGRRAVWLGCPHHDQRLWQMGTAGNLTGSKDRFANMTPVAALGEIVLSSPSTHRLLALTKPTAKPHTIVGSR